MLHPQRAALWRRAAAVLGGCVVLIAVLGAAAVNQLSLGVLIGTGASLALWVGRRRETAGGAADHPGPRRLPLLLVCVPLAVVGFQWAVLPHAASWSRDRAIRHGAALIAEIEAYRGRRGHYPVSLQSLNHDVPTGVVGVERFLYEPNGEAYNLFFVRPHFALDASEVVMYNPRDEHRFTSHELDLLQYDGGQLDLRRGDRRRTRLAHPHWVSIAFD
jgi:hypothetical protein